MTWLHFRQVKDHVSMASRRFCAPIEDAAIFDDVYEIAKMGTDKAIGAGFVATGFAYNAEEFQKQGWEPPTSWNDLKDERYAGKLVVPPITNTTVGFGPTNMKTKLSDELADTLPYGEERISALNSVDWTKVNPARGEWTKQWTRRVER